MNNQTLAVLTHIATNQASNAGWNDDFELETDWECFYFQLVQKVLDNKVAEENGIVLVEQTFNCNPNPREKYPSGEEYKKQEAFISWVQWLKRVHWRNSEYEAWLENLEIKSKKIMHCHCGYCIGTEPYGHMWFKGEGYPHSQAYENY